MTNDVEEVQKQHKGRRQTIHLKMEKKGQVQKQQGGFAKIMT